MPAVVVAARALTDPIAENGTGRCLVDAVRSTPPRHRESPVVLRRLGRRVTVHVRGPARKEPRPLRGSKDVAQRKDLEKDRALRLVGWKQWRDPAFQIAGMVTGDRSAGGIEDRVEDRHVIPGLGGTLAPREEIEIEHEAYDGFP